MSVHQTQPTPQQKSLLIKIMNQPFNEFSYTQQRTVLNIYAASGYAAALEAVAMFEEINAILNRENP